MSEQEVFMIATEKDGKLYFFTQDMSTGADTKGPSRFYSTDIGAARKYRSKRSAMNALNNPTSWVRLKGNPPMMLVVARVELVATIPV